MLIKVEYICVYAGFICSFCQISEAKCVKQKAFCSIRMYFINKCAILALSNTLVVLQKFALIIFLFNFITHIFWSFLQHIKQVNLNNYKHSHLLLFSFVNNSQVHSKYRHCQISKYNWVHKSIFLIRLTYMQK